MCVIAVARDRRINKTELRAMWRANPDGAGVAWIVKDRVFFEKGIMTYEDLEALAMDLPRPYVVHTRIATVGGVVPMLTHPFVVSRGSELALGGSASRVLFHNGHWHGWSDAAKELPPLAGEVSDSRLMAHLMAHKGSKALRAEVERTQRIVTVTPKGVRWFGPGWREFSGIWTSNSSWLWKMPAKRTKVEPFPAEVAAWDRDRARFFESSREARMLDDADAFAREAERREHESARHFADEVLMRHGFGSLVTSTHVEEDPFAE
jgi:hypothetical protein